MAHIHNLNKTTIDLLLADMGKAMAKLGDKYGLQVRLFDLKHVPNSGEVKLGFSPVKYLPEQPTEANPLIEDRTCVVTVGGREHHLLVRRLRPGQHSTVYYVAFEHAAEPWGMIGQIVVQHSSGIATWQCASGSLKNFVVGGARGMCRPVEQAFANLLDARL